MEKKIAIRTDGSHKLGNGHIVRMSALGEQLKINKLPFFYLIKEDDFWIKRLKTQHEVIRLDDNDLFSLIKILQENKITHFIYDTRNDLSVEDLVLLKKHTGVRIIVIDTPEDTRLAADVNIYPPIVQIKEWNWDNYKGKICSGWEYVLLRSEFTDYKKAKPKNSNRVLLSFGSTDPFRCTEKVIKAIAESGPWKDAFRFVVVCGPQFNRIEDLKNMKEFGATDMSICQAPENIAEMFHSAIFAVVAFGVTAYELAALKVPSLYISISEDHEKSAQIFDEVGFGKSLGCVNMIEENFEIVIQKFIQDLVTGNNAVNNIRICDWDLILKTIIE